MRSSLFLLLLLSLASASRADYWRDAWLDPALLESMTLDGGSGFIHVPAPQSLPNGLLAGGLHAYRVGVGRGFPYGLEGGLQMEMDGLDQDGDRHSLFWRQLLYARWSPPLAQIDGLRLSLGVEGAGLNDVGVPVTNIAPLDRQERQYAVFGGPVPGLPMAYAALGYGGGSLSGAFGALAIAPFAGAALLMEYDHGTDLGLRFLLSTQIKLDLAISALQSVDWNEPFDLVLRDNVRFGISYAEVWP